MSKSDWQLAIVVIVVFVVALIVVGSCDVRLASTVARADQERAQ